MGTVADKPGVVYGIRLTDDDEYRYIGIAANLQRRKTAHRGRAKAGAMQPVYRWIRKHGFEAISFDVLEEHPDRASLCAAEIRLIAEHRLSGRLLNMTDGGDGGAGYRHTAEWKALLSARTAGPKNRNWGKPADPEHMRKMTEAARVRIWTPEQRAAVSARMATRIHTPERNAKIAAAKLEYWANWRADPANYRAPKIRLSESEKMRKRSESRGVFLSDETIAEMRSLNAAGVGYSKLIARFGISKTSVSRIIRRETYDWVA